MKTASILGVHFHDVTMEQAIESAMTRLRAREKGYVVTPNPEIVDLCRQNGEYKEIINHAALILPDGIGIIYAARLLGEELRGKVAGIEFAEHLAAAMARERMRLFLLGAKPGVAEQAGKNLCSKYPGLVIAGTHDGYFTDPQQAVDAVNRCGGADAVFVCLGAPKQEKFMAAHQKELPVGLMAGLGGSLDSFAGTVKRAPKWMIRMNLEWFYRLLKEPRRFGRMLRLPKFLWAVVLRRMRGAR